MFNIQLINITVYYFLGLHMWYRANIEEVKFKFNLNQIQSPTTQIVQTLK